MKIFVSGKIGQDSDVRAVMAALRNQGHEITFDWTAIEHLRPYEENSRASSKAATLEVDGVRRADLLVLLTDDRGVGMFVELGAALALDKPVYVVSRPPARTMFFFHPLVTVVSSIDELLERTLDTK